MSNYIPKYCALPTEQADSGDMFFYGIGETAIEAIMDFKNSKKLVEFCEYVTATPGESIQILVYSVVDINESDFSAEERDKNWKWCLGKMVCTVHITVPHLDGLV